MKGKKNTYMHRMTITVVGMLALVLPMLCRGQVNAEQVVSIGRNVLAMDDYMLAIQYFNQAIKAKPYLSDPYYYRGLAKLYLEDYQGTEQDCSLAIERNKFKTEAYKLRGFARQFLGNSKDALEDYKIGLQYNPKDKFFLYYKGVAEAELKKYESSDSTFSRLLQLFPKFEDGYTSYARTLILRGDTTAGVDALQKAVSLSKNQLNAWLMLADVNAQRKKWGDALTALDEAVRLEPKQPDLYLNRAYLRYNNDDYFGAMSDYNYTIELEPENAAAIFNRALLRYEVRDLQRAFTDFSRVLALQPDNFHARYNRGLIALETGRYKNALADFTEISRRYPRFYQAWYAIAECRQRLGDQNGAVRAMYQADDIVRKYVANPRRNPLDRPTIQPAIANTKGEKKEENESDIDVMERFNRLVTVQQDEKTPLAYNEKYKGKVQDLALRVEPAPVYGLSFAPQPDNLAGNPNYSHAVDELNRMNLIPTLYVSNQPWVATDSVAISDAFRQIEELTATIDRNPTRAADFLGRGVLNSMLKNYDAAIDDFSAAVKLDNRFAAAYYGRAYAIAAQAAAKQTAQKNEDKHLTPGMSINPYHLAMVDYDKVIELYPDMEYAWFDKGVLCLLQNDYTSALQCFSDAIRLRPGFGEAYYNRGYTYLKMGNKTQAIADLRKAGELGILPSYNILKRMK